MIHVKVSGQGEPLVLLHGWGMNGAVWQRLVPELESRFSVVQVDLPGHGQSACVSGGLEEWADAVLDVLPERFCLLGWSLGGLLALMMHQRAGARVDGLILLASSPCFVRNQAWPGMELGLLEQFSQDLTADLGVTIKTFLALQFYGLRVDRAGLRALQRAIAEGGEARPEALRQGLVFLKSMDLRDEFAAIKDMPLGCLLGKRDRLVSAALQEGVQKLNAAARVDVLAQAGHAPFVSHPELVGAFIHDCFA